MIYGREMELDTIKYSGLSFTADSFLDEHIRAFLDDFSSDTDTMLCHTSGSTGVPKDIWVKKSAMLYSARNTVRFFGLDEDKLGLLCLPAKYIAGRMMLVRALVSGISLHSVSPSLNPLKNITHTGFDFAAFTPAQITEILADKDSIRIFANIKHVIIGGAAIDMELEKKLRGLSTGIYATYGMTETVSHIALRKLGEDAYRKISPETILGVDDEHCLWIRDENLHPDTLQTNDVVQLLGEDSFVWMGRRDFVINSGGVKLHPEQIEDKIRSCEGWADLRFFITKANDMRFGERPLLVVEKNEYTPPLESLTTVLNKMEMPQRMVEASAFIYTESGKLNRVETIKLLADIIE